MQRARISWVPTALAGDGIDVDWAALDGALRHARLLFINSPCNPTGGVFSPSALCRIVELAAHHDVLIVSDEVYNRFVFQGSFQATALCPKAFQRTITIRSLSKEYGMAGFRLGWMAAPEGLMRPMLMHHVVTSAYVPTVCQKFALRVLDAPDRDARRVLPDYRRRRELVASELKSIGLDVTPPQGAFYFWFRIPPPFDNAMDFVTRLMEEERVLLMPGNYFGPSGRFHVRLSLTTAIEDLSKALRRLAAFMHRDKERAQPQVKG
jgi:aminotransferase